MGSLVGAGGRKGALVGTRRWFTIAVVLVVGLVVATTGVLRYLSTPKRTAEGNLVVRQSEMGGGGFVYSVTAGPLGVFDGSTDSPASRPAVFMVSRTILLPCKGIRELPYRGALALATLSPGASSWHAFRVDFFDGNRLKVYLRHS